MKKSAKSSVRCEKFINIIIILLEINFLYMVFTSINQ